ncbi:MAG: hypothetical protein ACP6IT_09645 [Candidatus Thorarchaeota archaeon]
MSNIGISGLLIIEKKSGLPLLFQKLDPRLGDIDPALVAGFLSALQAFSYEVVESGSEGFQVDYGKRVLTIVVGHHTIFAALSDRGAQEVAAVVAELLREFETKWYDGNEAIDASKKSSMEKVESFREVIIERVGMKNISPAWIPEFSDAEGIDWLMEPLKSLINGKNDIRTILRESGLPHDNVMKFLTVLWANGHIVFRNLLERHDVVIPTRSLVRYVQYNTAEREDLTKFSRQLAQLLPQVVPRLDGRTTVEELMREFPASVYRLLDYLFEKGAVEVLSPEKKRILIAKELLELAVTIALDMFKKKDALYALRSAVDHIGRPEIASEIHIREDGVRIEYDFDVYDGLTPRQVMEMHKAWLNLMRSFVEFLPNKKRAKYVEKLVENIRDEFFAKYSESDLDGLDEFSFFLERILATS